MVAKLVISEPNSIVLLEPGQISFINQYEIWEANKRTMTEEKKAFSFFFIAFFCLASVALVLRSYILNSKKITIAEAMINPNSFE